MLFVAGLESMGEDELVALVAHLNVVTSTQVLNEGVRRTAVKVKDAALDGTSWLVKKSFQPTEITFDTPRYKIFALWHLKKLTQRVGSLNEDWNWNPNVLGRRFEEESAKLAASDGAALKAALRRCIAEIAGVSPGIEDSALACAVIHRAAKALAINDVLFADAVALEKEVFQKSVTQLAETLQKQVRKFGPDQISELERLVREGLQKLSEADREAIREALHLDTLSAEAMVRVFKTGGSALAAQMLVGSAGFGGFLFLTTTLHAVGLLLGTSFVFGTYAAASSFLAFLLSGPFLLLVLALTGGVALRRTATKLDDYKAQLLIITGHARLLAIS